MRALLVPVLLVLAASLVPATALASHTCASAAQQRACADDAREQASLCGAAEAATLAHCTVVATSGAQACAAHGPGAAFRACARTGPRDNVEAAGTLCAPLALKCTTVEGSRVRECAGAAAPHAGAGACATTDASRPGQPPSWETGSFVLLPAYSGASVEGGHACVRHTYAAAGFTGSGGMPKGEGGLYYQWYCVDLATFEVTEGEGGAHLAAGFADTDGDGRGDAPYTRTG